MMEMDIYVVQTINEFPLVFIVSFPFLEIKLEGKPLHIMISGMSLS